MMPQRDLRNLILGMNRRRLKICNGIVPPSAKRKDILSSPQTCDGLISTDVCNDDVNTPSLTCTVSYDAVVLPSVREDVYVDGMENSLSISGRSCRYCGETYSKSSNVRRWEKSEEMEKQGPLKYNIMAGMYLLETRTEPGRTLQNDTQDQEYTNL
ncbi:hypothetical protein PR048_024509 [Dryococelus australis]|uniref:Uncharacterized protein n=1 Tax=Dryococelus australis TaxID=614101 RepID=A0ABQ9GNR2_9NEOP|nr:hypothetical protein PR048_024509 [Dryococelus australis]